VRAGKSAADAPQTPIKALVVIAAETTMNFGIFMAASKMRRKLAATYPNREARALGKPRTRHESGLVLQKKHSGP
jgi:hypothetical protein